jgi:hypothetical protein
VPTVRINSVRKVSLAPVGEGSQAAWDAKAEGLRIRHDNSVVPIVADAACGRRISLLEVAVAETIHQTLACFREQGRRKCDCHRTSLLCAPWNHAAKTALLNAVNRASRQAEKDR